MQFLNKPVNFVLVILAMSVVAVIIGNVFTPEVEAVCCTCRKCIACVCPWCRC
jgi:hypothetical protein